MKLSELMERLGGSAGPRAALDHRLRGVNSCPRLPVWADIVFAEDANSAG